MKVLLVQPCFTNFGGYFRSIGIAKALAKKNNQVDLLISSKENSLLIKRNRESKNLFVYELPRINLHQFVNGKILRGILACLFILFKNYDIIHLFESNQFETNLPLVFSKILKKKVILDIDEEWLDSDLLKMNKLMATYIRFCDIILATKFDYLSVTSEYLVMKFRKLGVKNVFKIINGVDLDQFEPIKRAVSRKRLKIHPQEKIILSFGNTYGGERAYLLFKTFEEILKLDSSVKLYFNLDPEIFWQERKIKKNISRRTLKNVIVTGFIDFNTVQGRSYLGAADVILFLMGNSSGERACFPVRIGAYLNGERVIAINKTDSEAYHSLIKYNCIITGENPSAIAQEILRFFKNKKQRQKLETNVLKAKKQLSWDNLINGLLKFYQLVENGK